MREEKQPRGKTTLEIKNNNIIANNEKQILYLYSSINVDDILNKKIIELKNNDYFYSHLNDQEFFLLESFVH